MNDEYGTSYTEYQKKRGAMRKFIRSFYFADILRHVGGPSIDFGCGVGELLKLLPEGSIGFEVNEATVRYCRETKLPVRRYVPDADDYRFDGVERQFYDTFIMNHVLEHLSDPRRIFGKIVEACTVIGIKRIILVVPGLKGFGHDKTHKTYIDLKFLKDNAMLDYRGFRAVKTGYFPLPFSSAGKFFTHNELKVVYERKE